MSFRVVYAMEADIPEMMALQFAASEGDPFHLAVWGPNTDEQRLKAGERLLTKWRNDPWLQVIKCVEATGDASPESKSKIMAFCLWDIFEKERPESEWMAENELETCDWLQGREREVARAYMISAVEGRRAYMQGRPYTLLTNLCTHPEFQRRGAAMALVRWGMATADRFGLPAYLEASESGLELYGKLGFRKIGTVKAVIDGELLEEYPVMVREPADGSS